MYRQHQTVALLRLVLVSVLGLASACWSQPGTLSTNTSVSITPSSTLSVPTITPVPTVIDRGLAYGEPCKPPCWEGLLPGISTREDVSKTMGNLQQHGEISSFDCGQVGCTVSRSLDSAGGGTVIIKIENDVVEQIWGFRIGFSFTAEQLINLMGEPTAVYSAYSNQDCTCDYTDPNPMTHTSVHFLYPEQGAWFYSHPPLSQSGCICRNAKIIRFRYFAPMSVSDTLDFLGSQECCVPDLGEIRETDLVEWHGFGSGY